MKQSSMIAALLRWCEYILQVLKEEVVSVMLYLPMQLLIVADLGPLSGIHFILSRSLLRFLSFLEISSSF